MLSDSESFLRILWESVFQDFVQFYAFLKNTKNFIWFLEFSKILMGCRILLYNIEILKDLKGWNKTLKDIKRFSSKNCFILFYVINSNFLLLQL